MPREQQLLVYSIGHSTRTLDEFVQHLKTYRVSVVVDVRTIPRSRHNPQFNREPLPESLKAHAIRYIHMPQLGGLRRSSADSINLAWENKSFRGYADYMQTKEFADNLLGLIALAQHDTVAVMCAEAVPWRCHRSLIGDALTARKIHFRHILTATSVLDHELTPFAQVESSRVTYPLYAKEKAQKTLSDFGSPTTS
jgi:uncharacterized protein (DUF488 family)